MSGALLDQYTVAAFARHETFHLRFGWLRKGFAAGSKGPGGIHQARCHRHARCRQEHGQRDQVLVPGVQGHRA